MKIGVIGAGRLGICFALLCENKQGKDVLVPDIREDYVADLMEKKIKTNEPDVQDLLTRSANFAATTSNQKVIEECDVIYTLVATPSLPSGDYDVGLCLKRELLMISSSLVFKVNLLSSDALLILVIVRCSRID